MNKFLSTPSVGRATSRPVHSRLDQLISIHALRGEGDTVIAAPSSKTMISIHALRGEGDNCCWLILPDCSRFLSTPSVGRATFPLLVYGTRQYISIHALRGEGDFLAATVTQQPRDFYPRPPWGGRPAE